MVKKRAISADERGDVETENRTGGSYLKKKKMMKKNLQRLGGKGLSLEAFANAKTRSNDYNPSLIKKQKEFYKNAKFVNKYKRMVKQQGEHGDSSVAKRASEKQTEPVEADDADRKWKSKRNKPHSLNELYMKKREEEEKARMEREAIIEAKKEERQRAEVRRKELRQKMFKKTKSGQPVMRYRIEHLLQTIEGSNS
ncbi:PREDICTED: rRNA-processing protein FYV7 [Ipomoea nil]|uniref:rRNA-processing protein FYV7 n=1 Tax=Ipomoea nil TaxID=35883 RepID=UPI000900F692|nr:PREDICTED: rRNA-processing protein FYV7 [Ipomoea nil]